MGKRFAARLRAREHRDERIVSLYQSGMTLKAVGARVGMTWDGVRRVLVREGVPRKPPGWYPAKPNHRFLQARELVRPVASLYDTGPGTSAVDLARITGLNPHTVRRHLVALGVRMRNGAGAGSALDARRVREIKAELLRGGLTFDALASHYGVSKGVIAGIATDRTWKHVPWPRGRRYSRRKHGRPKKLTGADVKRIKALLATGTKRLRDIAVTFGITESLVCAIAMNKAWADVPWPAGGGYVHFKHRWSPKLDESKVKRIKRDLLGHDLSYSEIAAKYGIGPSTVWGIASGRKWKQVPWPNGRVYVGREQGVRTLGQRMTGKVLESANRSREERRKGERYWEESRGMVRRR